MNHAVSNSPAFYSNIEFNRYGLISLIILAIGCLGGIAVGLGATESILSMSIILMPTMLTLSLLLSVSTMKWIINSAVACVIVDVIMIAFYTLS